MAWPPITMATQHPDNATVPWWHDKAFIATQDEIGELLTLFRELPIDEYMWDWEGKLVDESVGEKLFARAREYFIDHPLGEELHLTYRIPTWEEGKTHRMARAFMNVLSLADMARDIGLSGPPVTEMFLPLTTSADQPLAVRKAFRETTEHYRAIFHPSKEDEHRLTDIIQVTPLVEDIDSLFNIERIIRPYWEELLKQGLNKDDGQRLFLARSDPALNSGLIPAVLSVRAALSTAQTLGEELGFEVYPVLGTGSLPFRGSVHPDNTDNFLKQYAGTRTYSIQSAFRYDYPKDRVTAALDTMRQTITSYKAMHISPEENRQLQELGALFEQAWKPTIESIAPMINRLATFVPGRRERLQHIGLFGYSRGIGKVKLPRAITFGAALYSMGIPPELIATGRGLRAAQSAGKIELLEKHYPMLRYDIAQAGAYFNAENLSLLAAQDSAFESIKEDIAGIESVLGMKIGPQTPEQIIHRNLTSTIHHRLQSHTPDAAAITHDIVQAGIIRRSLG